MKIILIAICCFQGCLAASLGLDSCDYICADILDPVCGSDGKTYGNRCSIASAICRDKTLTIIHSGVCAGYMGPFSSGSQQIDTVVSKRSAACHELACFALWDPVCGSDGKTYGNSCEVTLARNCGQQVTVVHKGTCDGTDHLLAN